MAVTATIRRCSGWLLRSLSYGGLVGEFIGTQHFLEATLFPIGSNGNTITPVYVIVYSLLSISPYHSQYNLYYIALLFTLDAHADGMLVVVWLRG